MSGWNGSTTRVHTIAPVIISCLISLILFQLGWFTVIENRLHDIESFFTRKKVDSEMVIVEIDHSSLKQLEGWPWPRRYYAKVIENLIAGNVKAIFIDIDFSTRSNPEDDDILASTLKNTKPGSVLMPAFVQYSNSSDSRYLSLSTPNSKFSRYVTAVSVNLHPDSDGLVRYINLMPEFAGELTPTAATIFNNYMATANERLKINFQISPTSFQHVSFADVYVNNFDPALIKDKYIIIGATALELSDQIALPVYHSLAGPVVQAIAFQTLVNSKLTALSKTTTGLFLILACLPVWLFNAVRGWRKSLLLLIATNFLLLMLSAIFHTKNIMLFDIIPFISLATLSFIFSQLAKIDYQFYKILSQRLKLNKSETMMSHVIHNTNQGIILLNENFKITQINSAAEKIFGHVSGSLIDTSAAALFSVPEFEKITLNESNQFESYALHKSQQLIPVEIMSNHLELNNERLYTIFIHDVSERKARQQRLIYEATHDSLTGLKNRAYLLSNIDKAITAYKTYQRPSTLIMIDLNNFKEINDTLSHNIGDKLLATLGKRFIMLENETTCVARLGGDEFSILTNSEFSEHDLMGYLHKLQGHITKPIELSDMSIVIEAAIGVAHIPEHATTTDDILIAADVAMYKSKYNKDLYSIYDPQSDYHALRNLTISNDIKLALKNNEFRLYYQPKIDFKSNAVTSLEALIRWQHPTLGLIRPDEFIPIVENSSLIKPMTMFTLEAAAKQQKELQNIGLDISIAVNLSAKLLEDKNLSDDINKILFSYGVAAKNITLEITESAAITNYERTLLNLNKLVSGNLKLSIDDFGTSHASFSYLKQLPAKELKIDKLFITDICDDESDQIITTSIISLAHGLKMQVVAEGIEDKRTYDYLQKLGCDVAQGYWISKPMPKDELVDWIFRWNEENSLPLLISSAR